MLGHWTLPDLWVVRIIANDKAIANGDPNLIAMTKELMERTERRLLEEMECDVAR